MVLVHLRTGMSRKEIAWNFGISEDHFSMVSATWLWRAGRLLACRFNQVPRYTRGLSKAIISSGPAANVFTL